MLMLLTGFVSVACGSPKTAVRQDSVPQQADGAFTPETYFKKVVDNSCHEKCLTAKVKCEIQMDGNSISTSGTLRMKKDDVIQISLLDPIVGAFELGRMEFTQDKLILTSILSRICSGTTSLSLPRANRKPPTSHSQTGMVANRRTKALCVCNMWMSTSPMLSPHFSLKVGSPAR